MQRRQLERALAGVPAFQAPRPEWEQYRTPDSVAADFLWAAHQEGAIAGKTVLDLGCGTGLFAIGAALLGARLVTGVDVDSRALEAARQAAEFAGVTTCTFLHQDLAGWDPPTVDTVLMNPPFGAQAENRHADRLFLSQAIRSAKPLGTVWFLAQVRTERWLGTTARAAGATVERVADWQYPILAQFAFHQKEAHTVHVGGYRMAWP